MFSHIGQNYVVEMKMGISLKIFSNYFLLNHIKIFQTVREVCYAHKLTHGANLTDTL
jgi:hypothetical protein